MADLSAAPLSTADIHAQYGEMTRRKRLYGGILLVLFVALMAAGFRTADNRNAGSFSDGIAHVFDYPTEVLAEAGEKLSLLPGHLVNFFPALIETLNIAAASTLVGLVLAPCCRCCRRGAWRPGPGLLGCFAALWISAAPSPRL